MRPKPSCSSIFEIPDFDTLLEDQALLKAYHFIQSFYVLRDAPCHTSGLPRPQDPLILQRLLDKGVDFEELGHQTLMYYEHARLTQTPFPRTLEKLLKVLKLDESYWKI